MKKSAFILGLLAPITIWAANPTAALKDRFQTYNGYGEQLFDGPNCYHATAYLLGWTQRLTYMSSLEFQELFRRAATIINFDLNLDTQVVDGRFRVDYSEYKIFINLSGTTKSVRVGLESDPPLERQQVMAILLFGKPLEGLDESQSGSVNNVDAAAKDGALSLASLYLFASTPIESVGYNPHTQGLTAKVKIANGTTLNVGANEAGLTDVGVTRRLSKHWRIQTTVKEGTEENDSKSASTLLEWFNRF